MVRHNNLTETAISASRRTMGSPLCLGPGEGTESKCGNRGTEMRGDLSVALFYLIISMTVNINYY